MIDGGQLLHELTMLYLEKIDIGKPTPEEFYLKYWEVYIKIGQVKRDEVGKRIEEHGTRTV